MATVNVVSDALVVRAWLHARLRDGAREPAPTATRAAWQLCLHLERVTCLLLESQPELPAEVDALVRAGALAEQRTQLAVRAHLATIARIAAQEKMRVVVLKSGVAIAEGRTAQLADLDVLASPEDARRLAHALDADGYSAHGGGGKYHLAPRSNDNDVAVEIHTSVLGFDEPADVPWAHTTSLERYPSLSRLAPTDHVWTMLHQTVLKHPARRTRLRDILLLDAALHDATRDELLTRIAPGRFAVEMRELLDIVDGTLGTEAEARRVYTLIVRAEPVRKAAMQRLYNVMVLSAADGVNRRLRVQWHLWKTQEVGFVGRSLRSVFHGAVGIAVRFATRQDPLTGRLHHWRQSAK